MVERTRLILAAVCLAWGCRSEPPLREASASAASSQSAPQRFHATGRSVDLLCAIQQQNHRSMDLPRDIADTEHDCACSSSAGLRCYRVGGGAARRRSIVIAAGSTLETRLPPVESPKWLRFSVQSRMERHRRTERANVSVELRAGSQRVRWSEALAPRHWVDVSLDISALEGQPLSLRVSTDETSIVVLATARLIADARRRSADASRPANVMVYLIDTLRPDHMSIYGYPRHTTPEIGRFFAGGLLFENAYSTAAWTRPATASVLTSLYPSRHGANRESRLLDEVSTLAEIFRAAGFSTWAFVGNGNVNGAGLGFEQGFDHFEPVKGVEHGYRPRTEEINKRILAHLEKYSDEPFFVYIHTVDPHAPYDPPAAYRHTFTDPSYDGPVSAAKTRRKHLIAMEVGDRDRAHVIDLYDGSILYQDAMYGELARRLEDLGLRESLVTVLTSDHGEEFFEHGDWAHGKRLYEEQIRIPLMIQTPAAGRELRNRRIESPVQIIDIMPTLLSWFGLPLPEQAHGRNLDPVVAGPGPSGPDDARLVYCEELRSKFDLFSVRKGDYKLIARKSRTQPAKAWEYDLFHLASDSLEQRGSYDPSDRRFAAMRSLLRDTMRGLEASHGSRPETTSPDLDEDTRRQLEALGYLDGE